jgi:hypothetical protein
MINDITQCQWKDRLLKHVLFFILRCKQLALALGRAGIDFQFSVELIPDSWKDATPTTQATNLQTGQETLQSGDEL